MTLLRTEPVRWRTIVCKMPWLLTLGLLATLVSSGCAAPKRSGAPWTIVCAEMQGSNRAQLAESVAETLKRTPGIRAADVFVVDGADGMTRLCYGHYSRPQDPKTGRRTSPDALRRDMDLLRELGTPDGRRMFTRAMIMRTPQPDVGDPAWDLTRVDAVYSLQVAAFEPTEAFWEYKTAAADYCAALREAGYEAYYHHAASSSVVTVGLFGEEGIQLRPDGRSYYSNEVLALQRDETLKYNLLNGHIFKVKGDDGEFIKMPSRLVQVPVTRVP